MERSKVSEGKNDSSAHNSMTEFPVPDSASKEESCHYSLIQLRCFWAILNFYYDAEEYYLHLVAGAFVQSAQMQKPFEQFSFGLLCNKRIHVFISLLLPRL